MARLGAVLLASALTVTIPVAVKGIWSAVSAEQFGWCELHDEHLSGDDVPVLYGRLAGDGIPSEVRKHFFPYAYPYVDGGCVITPESPSRRTVRFCRSCRKARRAWIVQHDWPRSARHPGAEIQ
jgi:hypothetical protein